MSPRSEVDARRIRFALTCAVVFAIAAPVVKGPFRWAAVTGVVIWLVVAGWVVATGRRVT